MKSNPTHQQIVTDAFRQHLEASGLNFNQLKAERFTKSKRKYQLAIREFLHKHPHLSVEWLADLAEVNKKRMNHVLGI